VAALRPGVEDHHRGIAARRLVEAANLRAPTRRAGIALRSEYDADRRLITPAQIEIAEHAVARGDECRQEIALEPRQQHLAFGVPEADIVFDELRPLARQHQPGIEHALERPA